MSDSRVSGSLFAALIGTRWVSIITGKARRVLVGSRRHVLLRRGAYGPTRPVVFLALIGLLASVMTAGSVALPAGAGAAAASTGATDGQFVAMKA